MTEESPKPAEQPAESSQTPAGRPAGQPAEPKQPAQTPAPQPRKFVMPGDVYIRPGIDDRPDPDKVLSAEDKAAIARLAVRMPQQKNETSLSQADLQATRMATEGTPAVAAATIDAAVPDPESAYMDMRDPMVAADGTRPGKSDVLRLKIGFVVAALMCSVPWAAATGILLPELLARMNSGLPAFAVLCLLNALGAIVAFFSQNFFAAASDDTRSRFGRRTIWIIAGGLLTGLVMWWMSALGGDAIHLAPHFVMIVWLVAQLCYGLMLGPLVSAMSDRMPDKFRPSADAWYGTALAAGQMLGGFAGVLFVANLPKGFTWGAAVLALAGIVTVAVWPREKSSLEMRLPGNTIDDAFASLRLGQMAPGFRRVFWSRVFMMASVTSITMVAFYLVKYGVYAMFSLSGVFTSMPASVPAAMLVAWMGLVAMIVSLLAAWLSGPISDRFGAWGPSLAAAGCVALGALMPILMPATALGLLLFSAFSGFGFGLFNAVGQELATAVLTDPRDAGHALGTLNLASTLGVVLAAVVTGIATTVGGWAWLFAGSIVMAAAAAGFVASVRGVIAGR